MISVLPIRDEELLAGLYINAGIQKNNVSSGVCAREGDVILGYCLYDELIDKTVIRYIHPLEDLYLADGILRSALHVSAERFVLNVVYSNECDDTLFNKLDFVLNSDEKSLNIDKLFGGCNCCEKQ